MAKAELQITVSYRSASQQNLNCGGTSGFVQVMENFESNLRISFSRPGKSWNLIFGLGKWWKIKAMSVRLVAADVKARTMT